MDAAPKWIPIHLTPGEDGIYLVYCPNADPDDPIVSSAWYDADGMVWSIQGATHWMPMPEPP